MKAVKYTYEYRPDGDKWRATVKEYIATTAEDIERIENIFKNSPNNAGDEYICISAIPF